MNLSNILDILLNISKCPKNRLLRSSKNIRHASVVQKGIVEEARNKRETWYARDSGSRGEKVNEKVVYISCSFYYDAVRGEKNMRTPKILRP